MVEKGFSCFLAYQIEWWKKAGAPKSCGVFCAPASKATDHGLQDTFLRNTATRFEWDIRRLVWLKIEQSGKHGNGCGHSTRNLRYSHDYVYHLGGELLGMAVGQNQWDPILG